MKAKVQPGVLRWARERASFVPEDLAQRVGVTGDRVLQWEQDGELTLKQLDRVAEKTYTPLGYLFLPEPPELKLPIPDFRTVDGEAVQSPSPELLDTIYQCQRCQDWFRSFLIAKGEQALRFVGSANLTDPPAAVATTIRETIGLDISERSSLSTWEDALRDMVDRIEDSGIVVMRNGVVRNNTHRKLDLGEFRGFVLIDAYAPLIFVNATDTKAARMFTLAHELAHVWLGQSGVENAPVATRNVAERFCNQIAAELLVPMSDFRAQWRVSADSLTEAQRLARHYKLSTLVVLIRAYEAGFLSEDQFNQLYSAERGRVPDGKASGGDFYRTQRNRLGKRFARAVIASSLEGHTLFRDALGLLGIRKMETFYKLAQEMGVIRA